MCVSGANPLANVAPRGIMSGSCMRGSEYERVVELHAVR